MGVFLGMTLTAFLVGLPALPQDGLLRYLHHVSRLWNLQQLTLQMAKRRILVRAPSTVWSIPNTCLISSPALPWILSPTTCPCCTSQTSHTSSLKACSCCSPAWNTHPQYSSWLPSIPSGQISPHIKILLYYTSECHIFIFMILKKTLNCSYPPQEFHSIKNRICFFHFVHCCIHPLRLRLPMSPLQFETHRPVIRSSDSSLQHLVPSTMPQSLFDVGHYS